MRPKQPNAFVFILAAACAARLAYSADSTPSGLTWHALDPCLVGGSGWSTEGPVPGRLTARAQPLVRPPVWELSQCTAGFCIRFTTDSGEISARWTLRPPHFNVEHMPDTGIGGLDLYARDGDVWRWVGLARPTKPGSNQERILKAIPKETHEYLMYLPLYSAVAEIAIGVEEGSAFRFLPPNQLGPPIVFYGTSITQGASASRPGMAYPAILGRRLQRDVVNLGFAGNAFMDLELAPLLAEIPAAAYIIDCLPNMDAAMVKERTIPFVKLLRQLQPGIPIVLVESCTQQNAWFLPTIGENIAQNNQALREAFRALRSAHCHALYYVEGGALLEPTRESAVDGIHPSDAGMLSYADVLEPVLRRALKWRDKHGSSEVLPVKPGEGDKEP